MPKKLAIAAAATLLCAAPAAQATIRTIDFTVTPRDYGWEQAMGTELPFGISADGPLYGQILADDTQSKPYAFSDGSLGEAYKIVGFSFTTGSKVWRMSDIFYQESVGYYEGELYEIAFNLGLSPEGGPSQTSLRFVWGGAFTSAGVDDNTNRVFCSGCLTYVESIDGVVVGEGGPGSQGSAVPEPATWAMLIAGFGTAGAALRRRRPAFA